MKNVNKKILDRLKFLKKSTPRIISLLSKMINNIYFFFLLNSWKPIQLVHIGFGFCMYWLKFKQNLKKSLNRIFSIFFIQNVQVREFNGWCLNKYINQKKLKYFSAFFVNMILKLSHSFLLYKSFHKYNTKHFTPEVFFPSSFLLSFINILFYMIAVLKHRKMV